MLWQMQQNMCCDQEYDDLSSAPACWSQYRIDSACPKALTTGWEYQETASSCTCMIGNACLRLYSIVLKKTLKNSLSFLWPFNFYFFLYFFFACFVCILCYGNCCLSCFAFPYIGLPVFATWSSFPNMEKYIETKQIIFSIILYCIIFHSGLTCFYFVLCLQTVVVVFQRLCAYVVHDNGCGGYLLCCAWKKRHSCTKSSNSCNPESNVKLFCLPSKHFCVCLYFRLC